MNLYFLPGVYERLRAAPAAMNGVIDAIQRVDGVARVLRSDDVQNAVSSPDPAIRAAALSYYPDRSGDLMIVLKPGWIMYAIPAMHGTASPEDQQVPLMLMGPGIKPGVYAQAATPADVVPTLASLSGVTLPRADGRVLREALR
jgi:predicted AlkP superfamily pyrophosphatase or phosphodiesterase